MQPPRTGEQAVTGGGLAAMRRALRRFCSLYGVHMPSRPGGPTLPERDARRAMMADLRAAMRSFDASDAPAATCYRWLCEVLALPPGRWSRLASKLLSEHPAVDVGREPCESRWFSALLKEKSAGFREALDGASELMAMATKEQNAEGMKEAIGTLWRVAARARSTEECLEAFGLAARCGAGQPLVAKSLAPMVRALGLRILLDEPEGERAEQVRVNGAVEPEDEFLIQAVRAMEDGAANLVRELAKRDAQAADVSERMHALMRITGDLDLCQPRKDEAPEIRLVEILSAIHHKKATDASHLAAWMRDISNLRLFLNMGIPLSHLLCYLAIDGLAASAEDMRRLLNTVEMDWISQAEEGREAYLRVSVIVGLDEMTRRALDLDPDTPRSVREKISALERYYAAEALQYQRYDDAAMLLAGVAIRDDQKDDTTENCQTVLKGARTLAAVQDILSLLSPSPDWTANPRRFEVFKHLLDDGDVPFHYIARDDTGRREIRERLIDRALAHSGSVRHDTVRALAILYWDWAREAKAPSQDGPVWEGFRLADFLWRHLLTDASFWDDFAHQHDIKRSDLIASRRQIVSGILEHHATRAADRLDGGMLDAARCHVEFLRGWDNRPAPALRGPSSGRPVATQIWDPELGHEIQACADELLNAWVSAILRRIEAALHDELALASLPKGMSSNYEGACAAAEPATHVLGDVPRIMRHVLKLHSDYGHELAIARRYDEARTVFVRGCEHARQFARSLRPGDRASPDNQVVGSIFLQAARLETDAGRRREFIEECRRWRGNTPDLEYCEAESEALAAVDESDFDRAVKKIDEMEAACPGQANTRQMRAVVHFRLGMTAATDEQDFTKAAENLAEATRLDPANEHFRKQLAAAYNRLAQTRLFEGAHDEALRYADKAVGCDPEEPTYEANLRFIRSVSGGQ